MRKKYKKFYMMFDKRFKNLILCSNLNCDGGVDKGANFFYKKPTRSMFVSNIQKY